MRFISKVLSGLALSTVAIPAFAQDAPTAPPPPITVTGNVTVVSDYRFRGLTQTKEDPAVQAALTVSHESGFYASIWASTIDDSVSLPGYGDVEIDISAGYSRTFDNGLGIDVGLLYYWYAGGTGNTDFFEPYASVSYAIGPAKAKVGVNWAWSGQNGLANISSLYTYASLDVAIPGTPLTAKGKIGVSDGRLGAFNTNPLDDTYTDWSLGLEATIADRFVIGVAYVDTDISHRFRRAQTIGADPTVLGYIGFTF